MTKTSSFHDENASSWRAKSLQDKPAPAAALSRFATRRFA